MEVGKPGRLIQGVYINSTTSGHSALFQKAAAFLFLCVGLESWEGGTWIPELTRSHLSGAFLSSRLKACISFTSISKEAMCFAACAIAGYSDREINCSPPSDQGDRPKRDGKCVDTFAHRNSVHVFGNVSGLHHFCQWVNHHTAIWFRMARNLIWQIAFYEEISTHGKHKDSAKLPKLFFWMHSFDLLRSTKV